jgi:hypothetical protein
VGRRGINFYALVQSLTRHIPAFSEILVKSTASQAYMGLMETGYSVRPESLQSHTKHYRLLLTVHVLFMEAVDLKDVEIIQIKIHTFLYIEHVSIIV